VKKSYATTEASLKNVFFIKRISRWVCRTKSQHEDW